MTKLKVLAIDSDRLEGMRAAGHDGHGNRLAPFPALGWEPTRCCLRVAGEGESILLISFAPVDGPSPWAEVGPVYVHAAVCEGYRTDQLPDELRTGPRVLRTYHADRTLNYEDIALVERGLDIEPTLREVLGRPNVDEVHVRATLSQCWAYSVRSSD
jgi:Protein of unknown function (DUF1203)